MVHRFFPSDGPLRIAMGQLWAKILSKPPLGALVGGVAISLPLQGPLQPAVLVDRPNRYMVRASLQPSLEVVAAAAPPNGSALDQLKIGQPLWLQSTPQASERWRVAVTSIDERLVSLDPRIPTALLRRGITTGSLPELEGWEVEDEQLRVGRYRFDLLLTTPSQNKMAVVVHSVTQAEGDAALFPDQLSDDTVPKMRALSAVAERPGWSVLLFFVAQRIDVQRLLPNLQVDPMYARALIAAEQKGVVAMARRCQVTLEEVTLGRPLPILLPTG